MTIHPPAFSSICVIIALCMTYWGRLSCKQQLDTWVYRQGCDSKKILGAWVSLWSRGQSPLNLLDVKILEDLQTQKSLALLPYLPLYKAQYVPHKHGIPVKQGHNIVPTWFLPVLKCCVQITWNNYQNLGLKWEKKTATVHAAIQVFLIPEHVGIVPFHWPSAPHIRCWEPINWVPSSHSNSARDPHWFPHDCDTKDPREINGNCWHSIPV